MEPSACIFYSLVVKLSTMDNTVSSRVSKLVLSLCRDGTPFSEICSTCEITEDQIYLLISSATKLPLNEVRIAMRLHFQGWSIHKISDRFAVE
jgi:hypothetical protein